MKNSKNTVAIICAHPDDLIACLGFCHLARDIFDIHVIDFTHGERGCGEEKFRSGWTKAKRTAAEEAVCASIGATLHWLDEVDGEAYARPETVTRLAAILKELAPRAVIAHWPVDVHTDHVMTSAATLKALFLADIHPEIWFMDQTHQCKRFVPDVLLDFTSVADKVWNSLRLYECQYSGGGLENRRQALARLNGMRSADYASGVLAEGFMRFVPPRQGERSIFDELPYPGNGIGVVFQGARLVSRQDCRSGGFRENETRHS